MNNFKNHIVFRVFALFVVAILLLPASVKMAHIFEHHEHKVCNNDSTTHFHQVDLDCKFHKFQLNHYPFIAEVYSDAIPVFTPNKISPRAYNFLINHQRLSFSLRAPPVLV